MVKREPKIFIKSLIFVSCLFLFGCASHTVISRTYNFNNMKRIGILKVDVNNAPLEGVEDLFAEYLIKNGFTVVERAELEQVMNEHKIGMQGALDPSTTKELGHLLGVDVLLIGEVSSYTPEKETTTIAKTQNTYVEPTYSTRTTIINGTPVESIYQTGTSVRKEKNLTPITYTESPKVGLIAKLVDVETAQIVWVGSITEDGDNDMVAAENCVDYLVSNLHKDMKSVLEKKNK